MTTIRSPLSGKVISRKEAYKDIGDPKTWVATAAKLMLAF